MRTLTLLTFLPFLLAQTTAPTETYPIRFDRLEKPGQKFSISQSVEITQSVEAALPNAPIHTTSASAKYALEGTLEILAVDDKNHRSKFLLTIKKLTATETDAPPESLLKEELQLEATLGDNKIECKFVKTPPNLPELAGHAMGALPIFLPRPANAKFTTDEFMGTADRKKTGDAWPLNLKLAAESMGLTPEKSSGTVKLESVTTDNNHKWLNFTESLDASEVNDPNLGKSIEAKVSARGTHNIPLDPADPSEKSEGTRQLHAVFKARQQDGTIATLTLTRAEKRTSTILLQPAKPNP